MKKRMAKPPPVQDWATMTHTVKGRPTLYQWRYEFL